MTMSQFYALLPKGYSFAFAPAHLGKWRATLRVFDSSNNQVVCVVADSFAEAATVALQEIK